MPCFPFRPEAYKCYHCEGWFLYTFPEVRTVCQLVHPPGSCCHIGETEAPTPIRCDGSGTQF